MYFDTKSVGGTTEILASNDYQAVPVTITGGEVVKAGMPIKADGSKIAAGTDAIGILLYDVDPNRDPNGAVVVDGIINWDKCKDHVGGDLTIGADEISKILSIPFFGVNSGTSEKPFGGMDNALCSREQREEGVLSSGGRYGIIFNVAEARLPAGGVSPKNTLNIRRYGSWGKRSL